MLAYTVDFAKPYCAMVIPALFRSRCIRKSEGAATCLQPQLILSSQPQMPAEDDDAWIYPDPDAIAVSHTTESIPNATHMQPRFEMCTKLARRKTGRENVTLPEEWNVPLSNPCKINLLLCVQVSRKMHIMNCRFLCID